MEVEEEEEEEEEDDDDDDDDHNLKLTITLSLTVDVERHGSDLHGVRVDLARVLARVRRSHAAHVQVPLLDVRSLQADALVRDDATVLEGEQLAPVVQPHHLHTVCLGQVLPPSIPPPPFELRR